MSDTIDWPTELRNSGRTTFGRAATALTYLLIHHGKPRP